MVQACDLIGQSFSHNKDIKGRKSKKEDEMKERKEVDASQRVVHEVIAQI